MTDTVSSSQAAAHEAAKYSDLELEPFFESSDSEDGEGVRRPARGAVPTRAVDEAVTEEEIAADLAKIEFALEQQPYRKCSSRQLRQKVQTSPVWADFDTRRFDSVRVAAQDDIDILQPALLSGLLEQWPARRKWTKEGLLKHYASLPVVATRLIAAANMGKSNPVTVKLASYFRYCEQTDADFPLYVFDHNLPSSELGQDYSPPPIRLFDTNLFDPERYPASFPRDSFGYFSKTEWAIIGPKISGSPIHQDPLYTSAWNSLLLGCKHWAVFPPHVPLERLRKRPDWEPPLVWFIEELPKLRQDPEVGLIEITQKAGDTVFLPEGWWHAVLNLDEINVAVTHNAVIALDPIYERLTKTHPEFCEAYKNFASL